MTQGSSLQCAIAGALEKCGSRGGVRATGRAAWTLELGNGTPLPVAARWEEGWLQLRAPIAGAAGAEASWRFLLLNGLLSGAARVVRAEREQRMEFRAEVPLQDVDLLSARLEAVCESLRRANAVVAGKEAGSADAATGPGSDGKPEFAWVELAEERGWRLEPREANRFVVELDAPGLPSQASIEPQGREISLWIDVLKSGGLSEQSRRAAAQFLLTLTGLLRMVRGAASETDVPAVRLEVRLPADPTGAELDLALAALSLACRLGTRELRGLSDHRLAKTYLDHLTKE